MCTFGMGVFIAGLKQMREGLSDRFEQVSSGRGLAEVHDQVLMHV